MITSELVDKVREANPKDFESRAQAERAVKATFDSIKNAVADGDTVYVAGFGIFRSSYHTEKTLKLPNSDEQVTIPARRVPAFRAKKAFKDQVAGFDTGEDE